jgi:hypothetical protein
MGRAKLVDAGAYDALLTAYRAKPGNARQAAAATGLDARTCARGWREGWPERGMRPIQAVLEDEQAAARARLHAAREAELRAAAQHEAQAAAVHRQSASEDAIRNRAEEARMVRAARANAMGLMAVVQRVLRGANALAEQVEQYVQNAKVGTGEEDTLTPQRATALFAQIASTTRAANESARLAQQMERSLLGEPDKWIGLQVGNMTEAQAVHEIELAHRAAQRARERGVLTDGEEVLPPPLPPVAAAPTH